MLAFYLAAPRTGKSYRARIEDNSIGNEETKLRGTINPWSIAVKSNIL
jgi:hypothetical protein